MPGTYEKISLKERLGQSTVQRSEEPPAISKYSLKERLEKASNGESPDIQDLSRYIGMIKRSANLPLSEMMNKVKLADFKNLLNRCSTPATYGEAAALVATAWNRVSEKEEEQELLFSHYLLPDYEKHIFFDLWDCFHNELTRRTNAYEPQMHPYKDISALFPAFTIPLPTYLKAAAQCCNDIQGKEILNNVYKESIIPLMNAHTPVVTRIKQNLQYQPDKKTCYSDPVMMLDTILDAFKHNALTSEEYDDLVYDLIILPYLI